MARKLPQPISKEEFEKIFSLAKDKREKFRKPRSKRLTPRGIRINQYMIAIALGFNSGMRVSEIVGGDNVPALLPENVGRDQIRVVRGKGGKDRVVPRPRMINQEAIKELPLKISRRQLQRFITELGNEALKKHITFHMLRHGFVTHAIEMGMDLGQVQMLAGHSRLDTTGIYLHVNPTKALEKYQEVF